MDLEKVTKEVYDMSRCLPQSYLDEKRDDDELLRSLRVKKSQVVGNKVVIVCLQRDQWQKVW